MDAPSPAAAALTSVAWYASPAPCRRDLGHASVGRASQILAPQGQGLRARPAVYPKDKGIQQGQGRRTHLLTRALFSKRLRMSVSRWGANNHAPRAPALHRRLASQQRAYRFLIVSFSALQKAREKARFIPVGCCGA
jgi:hypothetical protein